MRPDITRGGESPAGERDLQTADPAAVTSRGLTEEEQALLALPSLEDPPGRLPRESKDPPPVEPVYGALDPSDSFWSFGGPPEGSRRRRPVDGWGCRWYSDDEPGGS